MNRKGFGFIAVIWFLGSLVVGGFVANYALETYLGIGLIDLFNIVMGLGNTQEDVPSLEEVRTSIGEDEYALLSAQAGNISTVFSRLGSNLDQLNNNTDLTSILGSAFGESFKLYMYSITTFNNVTFKVFEWSIKLDNGSITDFERGRTFSTYDVYAQVDHEVANQMFSGQVQPDNAIQWVKDGKIKLKPITFVLGFANALPQIVSMMQRQG